ncbi:MAG: flagellar protein FlaF [Methanomicrobiales archaeon]|nr:flagellar protein FlaF [Methanomicrobiales archaeon]
MGAGTIIASAIVIVLLIITGYVLIGGTLSTAQIVMAAQRAAAEKEGQRIHTRIEIINASTNETSSQTFVEVKNTGSEVVGDFHHMELYLLQGGTPYTYTNLSVAGNWTYSINPDLVHPNLLDPDEVANITVSYDPDPLKGPPTWVKVTTANGVYDSAYIVP